MKHNFWQNHWIGYPLWEWALDISVITLLTICFSWLIHKGLVSTNILQSIDNDEEPELLDLYVLSEHQSGKVQSSDIVLINIDSCSRRELTQVLQLVNEMNPLAIGMDCYFPFEEQENDSDLIRTILHNPRIVLASYPKVQKDGSIQVSYKSYFDSLLLAHQVRYGSVRFDITSRSHTIRTYTNGYLSDSDTIPSLEAQLYQIVFGHMPLTAFFDHQYIRYPNVSFDTIACRQLLLADDIRKEHLREIIEDKIILIGDLYEARDLYSTPINPEMPGLLVHAYILNHMIIDCPIRVLPTAWSWAIAVVVCILFSLIICVCKRLFDEADGLVMRVIQVFLITCVILVGILCYSSGDYYFNWSPTFFALALQAVAMDVVLGAIYLIRKGIYSWRQKSNKDDKN